MKETPSTYHNKRLKNFIIFSMLATSLSVFAENTGNEYIVNEGDEANFWDINPGDRLTISPGGKARGITLYNAELNMDSGMSSMEGTGAYNGSMLYLLDGSYALIKNSTISSRDNYSWESYPTMVMGDESSNIKNKALIINSQIFSETDSTGSTPTLLLNRNSELALDNSEVQGSGIWVNDSKLYAKNSVISGASAAVRINSSEIIGSSAEFRNTKLIGLRGDDRLSGYALVIRGENDRSTASVLLADGTELRGGDDGYRLIDISGNALVNLTVDNSNLNGHITVENPAFLNMAMINGAKFTGSFLTDPRSTQGDINLALNSLSSWHMTENQSIGILSMDNGLVKLSSDKNNKFNILTVNQLEGKGTFEFNTDLSKSLSDRLIVNGTAEGNHLVKVINRGKEPVSAGALTLIETNTGNANFTLNGGSVDIGAFQYFLTKRDGDWVLESGKSDPTDPINPVQPDVGRLSHSAEAVINMASASQFMFYNELESLRNQRHQNYSSVTGTGVWGSFITGNEKVKGTNDSAYTLNQSGILLGSDTDMETSLGKLTTGVFITNSSGKIKNARSGTSNLSSWGGGLYASLLGNYSAYVDVTFKGNHYKADLSTAMSDGVGVSGSWNHYGAGLDVETGMTQPLLASYYLKPYIRLSGYYGNSKSIELSNGMKASTGSGRSLRGEAGISIMKDIAVQDMTLHPYVKISAIQEFINGSLVTINDNNHFRNDLSGTAGKAGLGLNVSLSRDASVYAEAQYTKGAHIEAPMAGSVGIRITF